ncbi:MAG: hypothetical protein WC525_07665 [Candidatus Thermoplasmatota archaeon]
MELIATLVHNRDKAKKILKEVPNNSIVLLPESLWMKGHIINYYSKKKSLFIIYNQDTKINGKHYITMKGVDKGKVMWMVHKYFLWSTGGGYWFPAPKLDPIVKIRGHTAAVAICYELAFVSRFNKLYEIGKIAKKAKAEILLMPADWAYNFGLPQNVLSSAFNCIPSLKAGVFSCRQELAFVSTKLERTKITKRGWVSIEI